MHIFFYQGKIMLFLCKEEATPTWQTDRQAGRVQVGERDQDYQRGKGGKQVWPFLPLPRSTGCKLTAAFSGHREKKNTSSLPKQTIGLPRAELHPDSLGLSPAWGPLQHPLEALEQAGQGVDQTSSLTVQETAREQAIQRTFCVRVLLDVNVYSLSSLLWYKAVFSLALWVGKRGSGCKWLLLIRLH